MYDSIINLERKVLLKYSADANLVKFSEPKVQKREMMCNIHTLSREVFDLSLESFIERCACEKQDKVRND